MSAVARVEAGDVYFCVNYGVCDNRTIDALRGRQKLSPVALTLSLDRTDAPFSPTKGILGRVELEHASAFTVSDFRYNRAYLDVAVYRPLPFRRAVGAAHVRAGWVDPLASTSEAVGVGGLNTEGSNAGQILHPRKRFYAGGSQSVRGFGENQLGPRVLTIDPDKIRGRTVKDEVVSYRCDPSIALAQCLARDTTLKDENFRPRPLGGTTLLEAGIEVRIPVWGPIVGAVFVDGAILGEGTLGTITKGTGAITPGFGVRYESPVGPIRVDLGFRPTLRESLPVITEMTDSLGVRRLVDLSAPNGCRNGNTVGCRVYPSLTEKQSFLTRLTNRLTLHLSIGQAF
jgi:outer membrane protein insertion porin family/translocation and assembly module TamA